MNQNIREILKERCELLSALTNPIDKKLKGFPSGSIKVCRRGNNVYFYYIGKDGTLKLLNASDQKLIGDLIQKRYLEKVLNATQKEISALRRAIKQYTEITAEQIFYQLKEDRQKFVKPIVQTDEQYVRDWLATPYTPKGFDEGDPVFPTRKGERVRSKSEMIIADRLLANGIPYKYECPIMVNGKIIHPDFTILRVSDRKILYLEHCGKADDPDYAEKRIVRRINDYGQAGIIQGDNLFLTFESSKTPFDVRVLDQMITRCFK